MTGDIFFFFLNSPPKEDIYLNFEEESFWWWCSRAEIVRLFRAVIVWRTEGRTVWAVWFCQRSVGRAGGACSLLPQAGRRKVRIQGMCFSWGYKAWCDGRGEKGFSFFVSVVRRLTFKEAFLSNKTLEILLNLCLYPEELVQTATVGSPQWLVRSELVLFLTALVNCCSETLSPLARTTAPCWQVLGRLREFGFFEPVPSETLGTG